MGVASLGIALVLPFPGRLMTGVTGLYGITFGGFNLLYPDPADFQKYNRIYMQMVFILLLLTLIAILVELPRIWSFPAEK